jgi:4-amino-4-deoxy-L-arabinose transferase-like glycosyltransferase
MFEIVATKLPHYVLPVFPAIALLAALGLRDAAEIKLSRLRWLHWLFGALFVIAACAVAALPIVAARQLDGAVTPLAVIASIFNFLVLVAGVVLWLKLKPEWLLGTVLATVLGYFVTLQLLIPSFDRLWVSDRLARVASNLSGCQTISVSTAGYTEPSVVFHFGSKTLLGDGKSAARHLAGHPGCGIAIVESREKRAFLSEADAEGVAVQRFASASGVNYVNGDDITLDIYGTETSALEMLGSGREELDDDE